MTDTTERTNTLLHERTAQVRQEWQDAQHRTGQVSAGAITYEEVTEILLRLAEAGVPPTVRAVREVYGGGSPNVITPLIRAAWIRRDVQHRLNARAAGTELPPSLTQLWSLLVAESAAEGKKAIARQQQEFDEIRIQLDAQTEALMQKEQVIDERVSGMQAQMALQEASLKDLRGSLAAKTDEVRSLTETLTSERNVHTAAIGQLQAQVTQLESTDNELRQQRDQLAAQLQGVTAERAAGRKAETLLQSRVDELREEVKSAKQTAEQARQRADTLLQAKAALELDLRSAQERALRADELEAEIKDAKTANESIRTNLEGALQQAELLRRDNLTVRSALSQAEASLAVHNRVEAELEKVRQDLATALRERDQMIRNPPALMQRIEGIEATLKQLLGNTDT